MSLDIQAILYTMMGAIVFGLFGLIGAHLQAADKRYAAALPENPNWFFIYALLGVAVGLVPVYLIVLLISTAAGPALPLFLLVYPCLLILAMRRTRRLRSIGDIRHAVLWASAPCLYTLVVGALIWSIQHGK